MITVCPCSFIVQACLIIVHCEYKILIFFVFIHSTHMAFIWFKSANAPDQLDRLHHHYWRLSKGWNRFPEKHHMDNSTRHLTPHVNFSVVFQCLSITFLQFGFIGFNFGFGFVSYHVVRLNAMLYCLSSLLLNRRPFFMASIYLENVGLDFPSLICSVNSHWLILVPSKLLFLSIFL